VVHCIGCLKLDPQNNGADRYPSVCFNKVTLHFNHMFIKVKELFFQVDVDFEDQFIESTLGSQVENICKISEVITFHQKILGKTAVEFTIESIKKLLTLTTVNLKHVKARLLTYWMSDLYKYLGQYIYGRFIGNTWARYTNSGDLDSEQEENLIGDIDFLGQLTTFEEDDDSVNILMPYTDCLRYMAINYIYHHPGLTEQERMAKVNKILECLISSRTKVPNTKWLPYNCDIAILDILKAYWDQLDFGMKMISCVVIFND
jgi:hypothetical protein